MTPTIEQILDLARWAPSGDNTQPWRFEVVDDAHVVVHGFDTREHCLYDIDGQASQLSLGALLETLAIAASAHGLGAHIRRRADAPEATPTFDVRLHPDAAVVRDPLVDVVTRRSVQRRPFATRPLSAEHKQALEAAVGPAHRLRWVEGGAGRRRAAVLLFRSARLRLVTPEAYRVHRDVIEWHAQFSETKVPDAALGVDRLMLATMRFAMHSWERVRFFNRFLAGTWLPRLQMDLLPGLACAAHFVLEARQPPATVDDHVAGGRAVQRLWLTATQLGLMLQPELTPLVFARYAAQRRTFSVVPGTLEAAADVARRLTALAGPQAVSHGLFMGRIGHAPPPTARSVRLRVAALLRGGEHSDAVRRGP